MVEDLGRLFDKAVVGPVGHHGGARPVELLVGVIVLEFDAQGLGHEAAGSLRHPAAEAGKFGGTGFGAFAVVVVRCGSDGDRVELGSIVGGFVRHSGLRVVRDP